MRAHEIVNEGRDAPLYHGYPVSKAHYGIQALKDNKMSVTSTQRFWPDGKPRKDNEEDYKDSFWAKGISFTRDLNFAASWGSLVFEVDQSKLSQKYKFAPINWFYSVPKSTSRKREKEEFMVVKSSKDKYMRQDPDTGEQYFDVKRFTSVEGFVPNLDTFLLGIYLVSDSLEIFSKEEMEFLVNHPKFRGVLDHGKVSDKYNKSLMSFKTASGD